MSTIEVGQENSTPIELYYEDHGSGRPVILVHGWPLSGASWERQVKPLLEAGHRVITYDRRGFGSSSKPAEGYNYDVLANDLHELITELDLTDVALVGFSMGGGEVARYFGKFGSERISKAVFFSAIAPYLLKTDDNPGGVDKSVFEGIKAGIVADRPKFLSGFFQKFYNAGPDKNTFNDELLHMSWAIAIEASPIGTLDCVTAWLEDFREDLAKIDVPTLVLHGDADQILPIGATANRMAEHVKGSDLVTIKGAPHGMNWTHADETNAQLIKFLGS